MKGQHHSPTSMAAAGAVNKQETLRLRIYTWLKQAGPATDEMIQHYLDIPANTQRPRRIELCEMGKVQDSDKTVKTSSGRDAVLWEAVEGGKNEALARYKWLTDEYGRQCRIHETSKQRIHELSTDIVEAGRIVREFG